MARKKDDAISVPPQKRGHGESTIVQRPDGMWMGQVSFPNAPDGKRVRKSVYGKTRAEVVKKVKALEAVRTAGMPLPVKDVTVEMLLNRWLEEVVKTSLKASTYRSYEQMVRVHIIPALGSHKVARLDVNTIDHFLQTQLHNCPTGRKTELSPQTVRYLRGLLHRAWRFGMKWGWVSGGANLITLSEPVSVQRDNTLVLSGNELGELTQLFSGHRDNALLSTALGLGLRLGEVLGLRWADVVMDDEEGPSWLSVVYQLQRVNGTLQLTTAKSLTSQRTLELPDMVADVLRERRKEQEQEQFLCGASWNNGLGLVFTNRDGGPLDPSAVRKRFRKLFPAKETAKKDGNSIGDIKKEGQDEKDRTLRLHDLRHIAASMLLGEGLSATDTAEHLGHADQYLVMRTYGHAMPKGKKAAAAAMNRAMNKAKQKTVADKPGQNPQDE